MEEEPQFEIVGESCSQELYLVDIDNQHLLILFKNLSFVVK